MIQGSGGLRVTKENQMKKKAESHVGDWDYAEAYRERFGICEVGVLLLN